MKNSITADLRTEQIDSVCNYLDEVLRRDFSHLRSGSVEYYTEKLLMATLNELRVRLRTKQLGLIREKNKVKIPTKEALALTAVYLRDSAQPKLYVLKIVEPVMRLI